MRTPKEYKLRIHLETPQQVKSAKVKQQTIDAIHSGLKTYEIGLSYGFIGTDEVNARVQDEFRKLKNRIAFTRDLNNSTK